MNCYGCRSVVMAGGLMAGLSVAAASLVNSIVYLYLLLGIIGGTGVHSYSGSVASNLERAPEVSGLPGLGGGVFSQDVERLPRLLRCFWRSGEVRTRMVITADWSLILASVVFRGLLFFTAGSRRGRHTGLINLPRTPRKD